MIFIIAIMNFYGILNVIKSTFVNESEGNKVIILLSILCWLWF